MNDRYLFRGQRVDTKEWVYGYLLPKFDGVYIDLCESFEKDGFTSLNVFKVIPETVGLWTTLKDKNGKLIFQNDIVVPVYINPLGGYNENDFDLTNKKIVAFKNGCFGFETETSFYSIDNYIPRKNGEYICNRGNKLIYSDFVMMKVIGNIHENPELLGGK